MFARCPSCDATFGLKAVDLAAAAGVVRCGHCGKTFNALSHLFQSHPGPNESSLKGNGIPPLLDGASTAQPELPGVSLGRPEPVEAGPLLDFADSESRLSEIGRQRLWILLSMLLAVGLIVQLAFQWQDPESALAAWMNQGVNAQRMLAPAEHVQIIARDMHRHPSLDDAIVISATLRNPGEQNLAWPVVEVRLYDASQQVLGVRRLPPEAYLVVDGQIDRGMSPNLIVPVILEFVVGSSEPSGFELRLF